MAISCSSSRDVLQDTTILHTAEIAMPRKRRVKTQMQTRKMFRLINELKLP